ncbi:TPA: glycosyltransferase family 52 [Streptococcus suis]
MRNLIFCQTPFQLKVALAIMQLNLEDTWELVILKSQLVETKWPPLLEQLPPSVQLHLLDNSIDETLYQGISSLPSEIDYLYVASLDSVPASIYLEFHPDTKIKTFDDGTASILKNGVFGTPGQYKTFQHLHPSWNQERIKASSLEHYTVFDVPSIIPAPVVTRLSLPFEMEAGSDVKKPLARVFIGQEIQDSRMDTANYTQAVCIQLSIDYYLKHPRKPIDISYVNQVETDLLAEDFVFRLLAKYECVEVYHYYSTTALLLKDLPNVKVRGIMVSSVKKLQDELATFGLKFNKLAYYASQVKEHKNHNED